MGISFRKTVSALLLSLALVSCGGQTKQQQKTEQEATAARISKPALTEAMKGTLNNMVKELKTIDFHHKTVNGAIKLSGLDNSVFLPIAEVNTLTERDAKLHAVGIYFVDVAYLDKMGKPSQEQKGAITRLSTELGLADALQSMMQKRDSTLRSQTMTEEEVNQIKQEMILTLMSKDHLPELVHILFGTTVQSACVMVSTPFEMKKELDASLVNSFKSQIENLRKIVDFTADYYPLLKEPLATVSQLTELMPDVKTARANKAKILEVRATLLK